jgi:DNA-binding GntR family transcriptional regulator
METRANTIRDALEQEIISGVRFPGERLDEPQLTRQFKVSRTPVRQMYEVLVELEGLSARLAVRRMTRDERSALAAQHARIGRLIEADGTDEFPALNKTFHDMIHVGGHNDILRAEIDGLNKRLAPYRRIYREEPLDLRIPY